jgi:hypothetical protein
LREPCQQPPLPTCNTTHVRHQVTNSHQSAPWWLFPFFLAFLFSNSQQSTPWWLSLSNQYVIESVCQSIC